MTKVALAQKQDIPEVVSFMRLKYKLCKNWPEDMFRGWLGWYIEQRLCVICRNIIETENRIIFGHLQALILGRPIENIYDVLEDTYAIDWSGSTFFVDIIIHDDNRLVLPMTQAMIKSVGNKVYLAFTRDHGKMERVRKYPLYKLLHYYEPSIRRG